MTWVRFISWLLGLYALYYVVNIAWDLMRSRHHPGSESSPELHFEETVVPQKVGTESEEPRKVATEPAVSAIGGVNLKDLFNLAKAEVIVYNRAVSF